MANYPDRQVHPPKMEGAANRRGKYAWAVRNSKWALYGGDRKLLPRPGRNLAMNMMHGAQRHFSFLLSVALIVGVALPLAGCPQVGGGESGAKYGPFRTNPNAKPGKGKFKSNIKCQALRRPSDIDIAARPDITNALGYAPPDDGSSLILRRIPSGGTAATEPEARIAGGEKGDPVEYVIRCP
jgi:hypothetical protein